MAVGQSELSHQIKQGCKRVCRSVRLEVLTDNSVRTTHAKYPSLYTHSCDEVHMVTGNTNRKVAEKLNGDHTYCSQIQQLDFNSCYLQLEQGLMLRQ